MHQAWTAADGAAGHVDDGADPDFRVDIAPDGGSVRVCPIGDLDLATVSEVASQLERLGHSGSGSVVLDLRGTTFIDSTGLRLVVEAFCAATNGTEFSIIAGPPAVQRAFDVAGLTPRLPFVTPAAPG